MAFIRRFSIFRHNPDANSADSLAEINIHLLGDYAAKNSCLRKVAELLIAVNTPYVKTIGLNFNRIQVNKIDYKIWQFNQEAEVDLNSYFGMRNIILICPDQPQDIQNFHERLATIKSSGLYKKIMFITQDLQFLRDTAECQPSPDKIKLIYYPLQQDNIQSFLPTLRLYFVKDIPSPTITEVDGLLSQIEKDFHWNLTSLEKMPDKIQEAAIAYLLDLPNKRNEQDALRNVQHL